MASILDYARLANAVYDDDPTVPGWIRTAFKPSGSGLYSAFQGAAFTRGSELVYAFKGTSQGRDVIADVKLGVGMNSSQFSEANQFVATTGTGAANQVTLCGHSLGGAIAQIVGNRRRMRFVTYNAPGVAIMSRNIDQMLVSILTGSAAIRVAGAVASSLRHPIQSAKDVGSLFHQVQGLNVRLGKDIVGNIGVHYGRVIEINYSGGALDVMTKHSIKTMISELQRQGYGNICLSDMLE